MDTEVLQREGMAELVARYRDDERVTHHRVLPRKEAAYADFPPDVHPALREALARQGIERLFSHQRAAVDLIGSGRNTVIVTPTASGKTLCYTLPVFQALLQDGNARAMYLFPTKALSQDQMDEVHVLSAHLREELRCFTYDGDTPQDARKAIRSRGQIVITNPDMLHQGILPHHSKWLQFFENLKFVVVDEMHAYRGVMGSHFTNLMRRLKRVARFYRSHPQFILSSATIANPQELAQNLIEEDVALIAESGAPSGEKHFFFLNPPVVDRALGIRANALSTAAGLARDAISRDLQTITFATSRLNVEILVKYLKDAIETKLQDEGTIRGYRGGYLPNARREIERGLREGRVRGVVSTNALELGIDIGGLDVAVLAGYPGSIASTWQQAGRAGRKTTQSAALLVARSNPLDQYIIQNPQYFFGASPEHGLVNPDNLSILVSHVKCAAFELPFQDGEQFGRENLVEILEYLENAQVLRHAGGKWHWMSDAFPADGVSLRSVNPENVTIHDLSQGGKPIAEVDLPSAPFMVHKDAIYLLEQAPYVVERFDVAEKQAYVRPSEGTYYTEAIDSRKVRILDIFETRREGPAQVERGEVHVLTRISGFKKVKFYTHENLGYGQVDLPDQEMHTTSYWFTVPGNALAALGLSRAQVVSGLLGASYALHHLATLALMCDIRDIQRSIGDRQAKWFLTQGLSGRGVYTQATDEAMQKVELEGLDLFEPTIFIFDNYPGGVGLSPALYERHGELLMGARTLIARCPCPVGCPSCVGPVLSRATESKPIAVRILDVLLAQLANA